MFTGIIEQKAQLLERKDMPQGVSLSLSHAFKGLKLGDSIAINGVCVTITLLTEETFHCDISPETMVKTTLGFLAVGHWVSLERPLTLNQPLGGHFVLGHVDEMMVLDQKKVLDNFTEMTLKGSHHLDWIVEKGSICLDGVSLTINRLERDMISCMIIPHTLEMTHLSQLEVGARVNVEYDYLAKLVAKQQCLTQDISLAV